MSLEGVITNNTVVGDVHWIRTGVELDAEDPRAILIEDVEAFSPTATLSAAVTSGDVNMNLCVSTGRVSRTASAPRNRLKIGTKAVAYYRELTGLPGVQAVHEGADNLRTLRGTLWVAPWIGLVMGTSNSFTTILGSRLDLTYRVVPIDFDLAHALFDMADEAPDLDLEWWNV